MSTDTEIYPVNPREGVHIDLTIPKEAKRLLDVLRVTERRTVSDLIREGISIVLVGYAHRIRWYEEKQQSPQPTRKDEEVQQP